MAYLGLSLGLPVLRQYESAAPRLLLCCLHTVFKLHYVWAVFLSWAYKPAQDFCSIVLVLVDIYLATIYMRRKERQMGSFRYFVWLLYVSTGVNLIFLGLMAALATTDEHYHSQCNQGIWPILLVIITRQSLTNPTMPLTFLRVIRIQQRLYPLVLGAFLACISFGDSWMILSALAFGYAEAYARVEKYYLSPAAASKLDKACLGGVISKSMGFFAKRIGSWLPAPGQKAFEDGGASGMGTSRPSWTLSTRLPMAFDHEGQVIDTQ